MYVNHYNKQRIDYQDLEAVVSALTSDFITTGPLVERFESELCNYTGASYCTVVNSCTSALIMALKILNIQNGDEVIVPSISFMATANAVEHCGGHVIFADVDLNTLLIDIEDVKRKITTRTKAIIAVDYAGNLCDYNELRKLGVKIISDSAHSFGALGCGTQADIVCTSFHPVKTITTCEGGALFTSNSNYNRLAKRFRNHGVVKHGKFSDKYDYDVIELGFNFRLSDVQCALGISQLKKVDKIVDYRRELLRYYYAQLTEKLPFVEIITKPDNKTSGHIMVIQVPNSVKIPQLFKAMKQKGIGIQVHYKPIYRFTYYIDKYFRRLNATNKLSAYGHFRCPNTERVADHIISLPLHVDLVKEDIDFVIKTLTVELARQMLVSESTNPVHT